MNFQTRVYINDLAEKILATYHIPTPISDIYSVVKTLGGKIVEMDALDDLYDGVVRKVNNTEFEIAVAKHQNPEDKKFAIACRLGHLFLHMGFQINENLWRGQDMAHFRGFVNYHKCCEANEFARALLMPRTLFKEAVADNTSDDRIVNIEAVANIFNVSVEMAKERAYSLGIARF